MLELLRLRLDKHRDTLVRCGPGEFQSEQGEARALNKLIEALTRAEPETNQTA